MQLSIYVIGSFGFILKGEEVNRHGGARSFTVSIGCAWYSPRCEGLFTFDTPTSQVCLGLSNCRIHSFVAYSLTCKMIWLDRDEFWDLYKHYFHPRILQGQLQICLFGPLPDGNNLKGKKRKVAMEWECVHGSGATQYRVVSLDLPSHG